MLKEGIYYDQILHSRAAIRLRAPLQRLRIGRPTAVHASPSQKTKEYMPILTIKS
jgi:hypothetical protein